MNTNRVLIAAGVITLMQAICQAAFSAIGLAQYYCVVDFMRANSLIIFIRILYFHNPRVCQNRINIGYIIPEIPNQAFVLLNEKAITVTRTFIINCFSFGFCVLWLMSSILVMVTRSRKPNIMHWPWIFCTVAICALDLVATVTYANDVFHTKTLNDIMQYIGGTVSGIGNVELDTSWASWVMMLIHCRFVIFFFMNVLLVVLVIVHRNAHRDTQLTLVKTERPTQTDILETVSDGNNAVLTQRFHYSSKIPRAGLRRKFRRIKTHTLIKPVIVPAEPLSSINSLPFPNGLRTPPCMDFDKKRTVHFPEKLLSLPQRLENLIAEQQKRLDQSIVDTAGTYNPTYVSQSLPQLPTTNEELTPASDDPLSSFSRRGRRRSTVAELQGQLPWTYIDSPANRMRDQLPPDEDLPPVPLPDYAAMLNFRKTSVHRAASSLCSLQKKEQKKTAKRRKWSSYSADEENYPQ